MYHSHGEGACHNPAINYEAFPSGSNKWKIKEDYFCKQCPTWVYEAKALDNKGVTIPATMKTVTACGEREKYATYSWNEGSSLQLVYSNVEYSLNQNDLELGNDYKKFRHFHRDLVPYCPEAYYYNTKNLDCNTDQDSETTVSTIQNAVAPAQLVHSPKKKILCTGERVKETASKILKLFASTGVRQCLGKTRLPKLATRVTHVNKDCYSIESLL
jgi:hypothetical protein